MAGDWIKLHRKALSSAVFKHAGLWQLWSYCLLRANWQERTVQIPGTAQRIALKRGQFLTGREALHANLYPERDEFGRKIRRDSAPPAPFTVWRWLQNLEKAGRLRIESVQQYSIVTVCKYDSYQYGTDDSVQPSVQEACNERAQSVQEACATCATSVRDVCTEEEDNNSNKLKEAEETEEQLISSGKPDRTADITAVIQHYRTYHPRSRPGKKERGLIGARFNDGYSVEDLKRAIDGCHRRPWNCGENPGNQIYQALELIVRDSSKTQMFIEAATTERGPVLSQNSMLTARAGQAYLERCAELHSHETEEPSHESF